MVVIFSKVLQDFPFFFGDVGEYGLGLAANFLKKFLTLTWYSIQSIFPEVVFCNLVTDMFSGSDVVYYGSREWGDGKFWNFLEQNVPALVSLLPERLLTHLFFSLSSSGSMEAVVSNKFFSFSDFVGSNSFTDIFF